MQELIFVYERKSSREVCHKSKIVYLCYTQIQLIDFLIRVEVPVYYAQKFNFEEKHTCLEWNFDILKLNAGFFGGYMAALKVLLWCHLKSFSFAKKLVYTLQTH